VFQELKQYLMSLPVMVAPKPGEHLLLYIVAKLEVMSMVLVAERPEPKQPQALKGVPAAGSGSQDPDPAKGPRDQEASRSQISEPTLNPNRGPSSRRCPRVPRTKRLPDPRSRSPLWGPTTITPPGPSPWRCPRILEG
jgi:hypothetical protein